MPFNSLRWSAARHSPRYFSNSTERRGQGRGRTVIPGFAVRYIAIMLPSQTRHLMCQSQTVVLFSLFFIYMLWRAERHSEKKYIKVTGFEPMALCTQNRCADQTALHLVSLPEAYRSTRSMNTN
uniref:Orf123b n=1 Tax=Eruca vesicaria subsp. sativa TaxID=29727 RepID=A0A088BEX4_ERUVS|nr:orf123b [Eruca vesicaria subsp. sativa]